jgi:hypothetical protein
MKRAERLAQRRAELAAMSDEFEEPVDDEPEVCVVVLESRLVCACCERRFNWWSSLIAIG